mgnify:CR=1 FL=1
MTKKIITITGAAGNIAYSLIFRILSGNIFHQDTKIQRKQKKTQENRRKQKKTEEERKRNKTIQ